MLTLQAICWDEVRFVTIEQSSVRVVVNDDVFEFRYPTREAMELELQQWFAPENSRNSPSLNSRTLASSH
jgi:hypothetical protein